MPQRMPDPASTNPRQAPASSRERFRLRSRHERTVQPKTFRFQKLRQRLLHHFAQLGAGGSESEQSRHRLYELIALRSVVLLDNLDDSGHHLLGRQDFRPAQRLRLDISPTSNDYRLTRNDVERAARDVALALRGLDCGLYSIADAVAGTCQTPGRSDPHDDFRLVDGTFDGDDPNDVLHHLRNRRLVRIYLPSYGELRFFVRWCFGLLGPDDRGD